MAVTYLCDGGCGHAGQKNEFKELGFAKKKVYCQTCTPVVEGFISQVQALHTEVAKTFKERRETLKAKLLETSPNIVLPDE